MTWALDLGSTSIKCCQFDLASEVPRLVNERSLTCPWKTPRSGWVEHDLPAMEQALRCLLETVPRGARVALASAMHSLVLLDEQGEPLCDALSWADTRSERQAAQLGALDYEAYQRTGTPIHSMAWPSKLLWVARERPSWWSRLHRISDLKSYLWERIIGQRAPIDRSNASATGLWNIASGDWDVALCQRLGLRAEWLPEVSDGYRAEWQGRTLFLGGADGPLGNLGVGAVDPSRIAVSVGTSGAVRRYLRRPTGPTPGLFLYALDQLGWVEGGAISNGGSVASWLSQRRQVSVEEMLQAAGEVPVGAQGLRVHPYFLGERAPFWRSGLEPRIEGENAWHGFEHLARATFEGVAFCLERLLRLLGAGGEPLRCTGGLFRSAIWCQLLADVTGREVARSGTEQATALGAALLLEPEPLNRSRNLPLGRTFRPEPRNRRLYEEIFLEWSESDGRELGTAAEAPGYDLRGLDL